MVVVLGPIVVAVIVAARTVKVAPPPAVPPWKPPVEASLDTYDPQTNPFELSKPNMLGLPLKHKATVVIDASSVSRDWLGLVKQAVMRGTDYEMSTLTIQVLLLTENGVRAFPDQPVTFADLDQAQMRQFLMGTMAAGAQELKPGLERALASDPEQVILVTGQELSVEQLAAVENLLKQHGNVQFDAVVIGAPDSGLQNLAGRYQGRCVLLSPEKLNEWYEATL